MVKKYKGFKGSGYNQTNKKMPKYQIKKFSKIMSNAMLSKFGIDGKY